MSRRIEIVDLCEHGCDWNHDTRRQPRPDLAPPLTDICPGGSRTVLDGIPEEWVERAGKVPCKEFDGQRYVASTVGHALSPSEIRAVLESILGETQ